MKTSYLYISLIGFIALSCKKDNTSFSTGEIDASRYVAIGTDATAGYMDDALFYNGQLNSYPAIIAQQLNFGQESPFAQPLIAESSGGINLNGDAQLILGYKTDCKDTTSLSPVRKAEQGNPSILSQNVYAAGPFDNLGIPGMSTLDVLNQGYGNSAAGSGNYNPFFSRFCSDEVNASILSDALARNPTFYSILLGDADIMAYATSGGTTNAIPPSQGAAGVGFQGTLEEIVSLFSGAGAKGAISTIPNVLDYPYFTLIPYNGLTLDAEKAETMNSVFNPIGLFFEEGDNPFTIECDCNMPYGVRKMVPGEIVLLSIPLDSVKCNGMGSINPIPDRYILTLAEIDEITSKLDAYNSVIENVAASNNLAIARFDDLVDELKTGMLYNGVNINIDFVTGGAFSLDGRNLNPIGQALLANKFIEAINEQFNADIPLASVTQYSGTLFP